MHPLFEALAKKEYDKFITMIRTNRELLSLEDMDSTPPAKGDMPIHRICRDGDVEALKRILAVSPNEHERRRKDNGFYPILIAAAKQHFDVVKSLIAAGANIEVRCPNDSSFKNYTTIFLPIKSQNRALVQLLVDAGADVFAKSNTGSDPASVAQATGNNEIFEIIKKAMLAALAKQKAEAERLEAKQKEAEKQKAELKKQEAELAAKAGKLQSDLKDMHEKHKQAEINYLSKVSDFVLDQYKTAAVDGVDRSHQFEEMQRYNRSVLAQLAPSNAQSAYTEAQKRQAQASTATGQTTVPRNASVKTMA